jgi:hypothetical protein
MLLTSRVTSKRLCSSDGIQQLRTLSFQQLRIKALKSGISRSQLAQWATIIVVVTHGLSSGT